MATNNLTVRFNPEDLERIEKFANLKGLTKADVIRTATLEKIEHSKTEIRNEVKPDFSELNPNSEKVVTTLDAETSKILDGLAKKMRIKKTDVIKRLILESVVYNINIASDYDEELNEIHEAVLRLNRKLSEVEEQIKGEGLWAEEMQQIMKGLKEIATTPLVDFINLEAKTFQYIDKKIEDAKAKRKREIKFDKSSK